MYDFVYILKDDEYVRVLNSPNPQYCLCERFFTKRYPFYRNFGDVQPFEEIVTVDRGLIQVIERLDEDRAQAFEIPEDQQILCVFCLLDKNGDEIDVSELTKINIPGFEFCGFDLADEWVSALTNCAGGFDKAFSYKDLNRYGLISEYSTAKNIQEKLDSEYDEEHTYCELFAIFRKVK